MNTSKNLLLSLLVLMSASTTLHITAGFEGADLPPADAPVVPPSDGNANTPPVFEPEDKSKLSDKSSLTPDKPSSDVPDRGQPCCTHCSKSNPKKAPAFQMPFFSSEYAATKPVYKFFEKQNKNHPTAYKVSMSVPLAIAATFLIGKGIEHTSALVKVLFPKKPLHKETEQIRKDLATKSAVVLLGLCGSYGLHWLLNGLQPA